MPEKPKWTRVEPGKYTATDHLKIDGKITRVRFTCYKDPRFGDWTTEGVIENPERGDVFFKETENPTYRRAKAGTWFVTLCGFLTTCPGGRKYYRVNIPH
jgi:hypothetical protein